MSYAFDEPFLEHFHVVHWDQRAAGRSAATLPDPETLNIDQYVRDTKEILLYVRGEFPEEIPLVLLGHSWGTILAMYAAEYYPELINYLVLVGAVVDFRRGQEVQYSYLKEHNLIGDSVKPPPWTTLQQLVPISQALDRAGMSVGTLSEAWGTIFDGSPDYDDADRESLRRGAEFTLHYLLPRITSWKIPEDLHRYEMPVTLIYGDRDLSTPITLGREYFSTLSSPCSRFVSLKGIGHFAMWEANESVASIVAQQIHDCRKNR